MSDELGTEAAPSRRVEADRRDVVVLGDSAGHLGHQAGGRRWLDKTSGRSLSAIAAALALTLSACCAAGDRAQSAATAADTLPELAFLVGSWRTAADPTTGAETTETWLPARSGVMFGVGRVDVGGVLRFHERLRIERRDLAACPIAYVAAPVGQAEVAFCLVALRPGAVTFANRAHDFPQQIDYVRTGDRLDVAIEGPMNGRVERRTWAFAALL